MSIKKIIMFFLIVLVSIYLINVTYSAFESNINASTKIDIAKFNILINNQNIRINKNVKINDITWINNHANKLAPGSIGEFYISLDPSNTDVSIKYKISFIDHTIDSNKVLTVTDIDGIPLNNGIYEDTILINNKSVKNIKVTVEWISDDDEFDSNIGLDITEHDYLDFNIEVSQLTE